MSARQRLSNRQARALFLDRHGLAEPPSGPGKGADLRAVIERLGFVQIDSVNTLSRAHHMILHARRASYREGALAPLHDRQRALFEHWTHDASLIDMAHFPHWHLRFRRHEARMAEKGRAPDAATCRKVLDQIAEHGACASGDVGEGEARPNT
ncbi:MAG: winged helix DNA-binding domain-containing protein, partial [Silicimonas sp.]|nr:winged helix DNA-binding domain-containing protein [Silicimonas sp.]